MKRLTQAQVLQMHSLLIKKTGGMDGVRDEGLLLVNNHPFLDGNKRTGILARGH